MWRKHSRMSIFRCLHSGESHSPRFAPQSRFLRTAPFIAILHNDSRNICTCVKIQTKLAVLFDWKLSYLFYHVPEFHWQIISTTINMIVNLWKKNTRELAFNCQKSKKFNAVANIKHNLFIQHLKYNFTAKHYFWYSYLS